ncbi:hypothetical protein FQR65_LT10379 [Abscondita terminalis]|nr:hypothetical protein FQR65_LT10379 [Abscondita terminalis]
MSVCKINKSFRKSNISIIYRTLFSSKKKKKIQPKPTVICPPTHEEIPTPSTLYQSIAGFCFGAILGYLIDTYGRPFYRDKFPTPPLVCKIEEKEELCPVE